MATKIKKVPGNFSFSRKEDLEKYNKSVKATSSQRMQEMKFIVLRSLLKPYVENARILDLGCGDAFYLDFLLDDGLKSYMGIDVSQLMINRAEANHKNNKNIKFIIGDMADEKLTPDDSFNCILSIFSLMRMRDINKIFKIVNKKSKKGGIFLIMINTYVTKKVEGKKYMVKIKKNNEVFFNNYPRSSEQFIKTAKKHGFVLMCNFSKSFSKDKNIISPNPKNISGYDSILMFKKE